MGLTFQEITHLVCKGTLAEVKNIAWADQFKSWRNARNQSTLFYAVQRTDAEALDVCRHMVDDMKLSINSTDTLEQTPIFFAARSGTVETVQYLVGSSADFNHKDRCGRNTLHYAAKANTPVVAKLLALGQDMELQDNIGQTPLFFAAASESPHGLQILELLLEQRAACDQKDKQGDTPLVYAVKRGNVDICRRLLQQGADKKEPLELAKTWLMNDADYPEVTQAVLDVFSKPAAPKQAAPKQASQVSRPATRSATRGKTID